MRYYVKTVKEINWEDAEIAPISHYAWGDMYTPEAEARLLYIENRGLAAQLCCRENDPKTVYQQFYEPVYKDSCLEFFFAVEKNGIYVNCEMNSAGASLIAVGKSRKNRIRIDEIIVPPTVRTDKRNGVWSVEVLFTLDDLARIFGEILLEAGVTLYGNFYKCGDETEIKHYGMWSPIGTAEPDFHRPEHFGELIII